jgi:hypothetical protein
MIEVFEQKLKLGRDLITIIKKMVNGTSKEEK